MSIFTGPHQIDLDREIMYTYDHIQRRHIFVFVYF